MEDVTNLYYEVNGQTWGFANVHGNQWTLWRDANKVPYVECVDTNRDSTKDAVMVIGELVDDGVRSPFADEENEQ